jgi:hypothetical protein
MAWVGVAVGITGAGISAGANYLANSTREPVKYNQVLAKKGPSYAAMQNASAWNNDTINAMREGKSDPYLQAVSDIQRKQSLKALYDSVYGGPGLGPGGYNTLMAGQVNRGLGRGAGSSQSTMSYLTNVSDKERAIDDSLNKYLMEGNYNSKQSAMQNAMNFSSNELAWEQPTGQFYSGGGPNVWDSVASFGTGLTGMAAAGAFDKGYYTPPAASGTPTPSYGYGSTGFDVSSPGYLANSALSNPLNPSMNGGFNPNTMSVGSVPGPYMTQIPNQGNYMGQMGQVSRSPVNARSLYTLD